MYKIVDSSILCISFSSISLLKTTAAKIKHRYIKFINMSLQWWMRGKPHELISENAKQSN